MKGLFINIYPKLLGRAGEVKEGGLSRDRGYYNFLMKSGQWESVDLPSSSVSAALTVLKTNITAKNRKLLFLYAHFGIPLLKRDLPSRILTTLFFKSICYAQKFHGVMPVFDVCDLKYEQSKDLELPEFRHRYTRKIQQKLFALNAWYIFASEAMMEYAVREYHAIPERCRVCYNGAQPLKEAEIISAQSQYKELSEGQKLRFVYAGTLNRGRMIEQMIQQFPEDSKYVLFLLGTQGEWIDLFLKETNRTNIIWIGSLPEDRAHAFVSLCDVGLIPYDDSRFYYNIAYPTKLSFYLTAGVPVLSTPVREVDSVNKKYQCVFIEQMTGWNRFIKQLSKEKIIEKREKVLACKNSFYWNTVFSGCELLESGRI